MKIRLADLEPQFVRYERDGEGRVIHRYVDGIEQAQGIFFLCPKCFEANGGKVGTHGVICWSTSRGAPAEATPGPGRWTMDGTGYGDLTLNGDPPGGARSVQLNGGCSWHGYITNGEALNA